MEMSTYESHKVELGVTFSRDENYLNLQNSLREASEHIAFARKILETLEDVTLSPSVINQPQTLPHNQGRQDYAAW